MTGLSKKLSAQSSEHPVSCSLNAQHTKIKQCLIYGPRLHDSGSKPRADRDQGSSNSVYSMDRMQASCQRERTRCRGPAVATVGRTGVAHASDTGVSDQEPKDAASI